MNKLCYLYTSMNSLKPSPTLALALQKNFETPCPTFCKRSCFIKL